MSFVVVAFCFGCLSVTVLCMWWPNRLNINKIKLFRCMVQKDIVIIVLCVMGPSIGRLIIKWAVIL